MSGLPITQIDHVSVLITDLERSRRFYRDVLGLKEIAKPRTFDFSVLWFDLGNQQLHLLLKGRPDALSPRHFALRVTDARQARAYFHRHGVALAMAFFYCATNEMKKPGIPYDDRRRGRGEVKLTVAVFLYDTHVPAKERRSSAHKGESWPACR
jgi:catechol 2,3-dioxygenase-like lactoylglutathione lyase family enzyme